jgi:hypothetical protein
MQVLTGMVALYFSQYIWAPFTRAWFGALQPAAFSGFGLIAVHSIVTPDFSGSFQIVLGLG